MQRAVLHHPTINQVRCRARGLPAPPPPSPHTPSTTDVRPGRLHESPDPWLEPLQAGEAGAVSDPLRLSRRGVASAGCWGPWGPLPHAPGRCSARAAAPEGRAPGTEVCRQSRTIHRYWHFTASSWGSFPNVSFPSSSIISTPCLHDERLQGKSPPPGMCRGAEPRWPARRSACRATKRFLATTGLEQEGETPRAHALLVSSACIFCSLN